MSTQSKADKIEEVRKNLPLPEQPPVASDWQSADARNVNVSSGGVSAGDVSSSGQGVSSGLREPASTENVDLGKVGMKENKQKSS